MFQLVVTKNFHESFLSVVCITPVVVNKLKCFRVCFKVDFVDTHELCYPYFEEIGSAFTVVYVNISSCIFLMRMIHCGEFGSNESNSVYISSKLGGGFCLSEF